MLPSSSDAEKTITSPTALSDRESDYVILFIRNGGIVMQYNFSRFCTVLVLCACACYAFVCYGYTRAMESVDEERIDRYAEYRVYQPFLRSSRNSNALLRVPSAIQVAQNAVCA